MPLKHLLEYALPTRLNHVPMTRNDPIKVPTSNFLRALIEPLPVTKASRIPQKPLLPRSRSHRILHPNKQPRQEPTCRILSCT